MFKICFSALPFLLLSINSHAIEPVFDQQAMFYFNVMFDVDQKTKSEQHFGLRFDSGMVAPGDNLTADQLITKPAIFNLKMNQYGLQVFELNGIDYAYQDDRYHATEDGNTKTNGAKTNNEAQTQSIPEEAPPEQPKKKLDIPLGIIIGVLIGAIAITSGL